MKKVELRITITAEIGQISDISNDLFNKIKEVEYEDLDFSNPIFHELESIIDYSQAFSIEEIKDISINKYK